MNRPACGSQWVLNPRFLEGASTGHNGRTQYNRGPTGPRAQLDLEAGPGADEETDLHDGGHDGADEQRDADPGG